MENKETQYPISDALREIALADAPILTLSDKYYPVNLPMTLDMSSITPVNTSVKIGQQGIQIDKNSDLKIGDCSLKEYMETTTQLLESISERINVLTINQDLEQQWQELHQLGQQYRKLEKEILEKIQIWSRLNT